MTEETTDYLKKMKTTGLVMSSVPKDTREKFVKLSEDLFADNYGACLKWCLDNAIEYELIKQKYLNDIDIKLDSILKSIESIDLYTSENNKPKEEKKKIKMLDGRKAELLKGGEINE